MNNATSNYSENDTIVAIATPIGSSGIGIVRISGEKSVAIAQFLFRKSRAAYAPSMGCDDLANLPSHHLNHGYILDPEKLDIIDEVLLAIMRAPHSYTREDVVEIQSHSGAVILGRILKLVIANGARLAMPGEFTRRAFLSGRIDLTQAEAVGDMIAAKSDDALKLAVTHLTGQMKAALDEIVKKLTEIQTELEAGLEFGEELESPGIQKDKIAASLQEQLLTPIESLISRYQEGCYIREGVRLGIAGRPNVGKSSLLNYLIRKDRAIVTELPGTTRDPIEEHFCIDGLPVVVTDTAGIHDTRDPVEIIGIQKAKESIVQSDLVLFMVDGMQPFIEADLRAFENIDKERIILAINKTDLVNDPDRVVIPDRFSGYPTFFISAKFGHGIEALKDAIKEMIIGDREIDPQLTLVPTLRQKISLEEARDALKRVQTAMDPWTGEEFILFDIEAARRSLNEITGLHHDSDILDEIFRKFCVGK